MYPAASLRFFREREGEREGEEWGGCVNMTIIWIQRIWMGEWRSEQIIYRQQGAWEHELHNLRSYYMMWSTHGENYTNTCFLFFITVSNATETENIHSLKNSILMQRLTMAHKGCRVFLDQRDSCYESSMCFRGDPWRRTSMKLTNWITIALDIHIHVHVPVRVVRWSYMYIVCSLHLGHGLHQLF